MSIYEHVRLPVGIRKDGAVLRDVYVDEMIGLDEENISNPKFKNAAVRALTVLLQRCVQEIPGLLDQKADPVQLAPLEIFRSMYQVDRDALVLAIRRVSVGNEVMTDWKCDCGAENQDPVHLDALTVKEWPDNMPPEFPFELPHAVKVGEKEVTKGKLRILTGIDTEQVAAAIQRDPAAANTAFLVALTTWEDGTRPDTATFRRMRTSDRNHIAQVVRDEMPGVRLQQDFSCAACGKVTEKVPVDISGFFGGTSRT